MTDHQSHNLFDRSTEYDAMLDQGLRLSGESKSYFAHGRLQSLDKWRLSTGDPRNILDFGCGLGETSNMLAERYPAAGVTGVDTSAGAIAHARENNPDPRISFFHLDELDPAAQFDLVYVNGVFHHIHPDMREQTVDLIFRRLVRGGHFALFDNNPWSPPARMVMARIPFDEDAIMLSSRESASMLSRAGFSIQTIRYLFFFPALLSFFRVLEPAMSRIPLGAQYLVLGRKQ